MHIYSRKLMNPLLMSAIMFVSMTAKGYISQDILLRNCHLLENHLKCKSFQVDLQKLTSYLMSIYLSDCWIEAYSSENK